MTTVYNPTAGDGGCGGQAGFTLIEVMVAMAIIATVMVALFRMQSGTINLSGSDDFQTTSRYLAAKALAGIELSMDDPELSGQFGNGFEGYEWHCEITDVSAEFSEIVPDSDDNIATLQKIELTITRQQGNRSYHVETFRYASGI